EPGRRNLAGLGKASFVLRPEAVDDERIGPLAAFGSAAAVPGTFAEGRGPRQGQDIEIELSGCAGQPALGRGERGRPNADPQAQQGCVSSAQKHGSPHVAKRHGTRMRLWPWVRILALARPAAALQLPAEDYFFSARVR